MSNFSLFIFEFLKGSQSHPQRRACNFEGQGLRKTIIKMLWLCGCCCTIKADFLCFPEGGVYLQVPLRLTGRKVWLSLLQLAEDKLYAFRLVQVLSKGLSFSFLF